MANKATKTEHCGAKNSTASAGYWGLRAEAKQACKKLRRANGKAIIRKAIREAKS